ncbi:MAG: PilZ domain-containing protein, partial [Myxococcales bacterium]|nr:PilZ domain-containing protein [Myxococcales bacterium]
APDGLPGDAALALYDGGGVAVIDVRGPKGQAALQASTIALVTVVAIAEASVPLPEGVRRMSPGEPETMAYHIAELLNQKEDLRRHPRVPVALPVDLQPGKATARNLSLYGMWVEPAGHWPEGAEVWPRVQLDDGAEIALEGRVVARRDGGLAVRCRPVSDADLLLWIHLLIGALEDSPSHADVDPFGPLFA